MSKDVTGPDMREALIPGGATMVELRGVQPGPVVALLAGVHGDEDEGVLAVRRIVAALRDRSMSGVVRAVAVANMPAWAAYSRTSPLEDGNLARLFPGDPAGSPTQRIAAGLTGSVIEGADLLIDLHSAGLNYAMPLLCGYVAGNRAAAASRRAAEMFGAPLVWAHPGTGPGRSLSVAADQGIAAIYAECGGGGQVRRADLDCYVHGVLNILADMAMLPGTAVDESGTFRNLHGAGNLDEGAQAAYDGWFVADVDAGSIVEDGAAVGTIFGYDGACLEELRAPCTGMVMFLRRQARVRKSDMLYVLARLAS